MMMDTQDQQNCDQFLQAVINHNGDELRTLLDRLSPEEQVEAITRMDPDGHNVVCWAAISNHESILEEILSRLIPKVQKKTIAQQDSNGRNAAWWAVNSDNEMLLKVLLDRLTSEEQVRVITQKDKTGKNSIQFAVQHKKINALRVLLQRLTPDVQVEVITQLHGNNALIWAVLYEQKNILNVLLENLPPTKQAKAIMQQDSNGHNAVWYTVQHETDAMLKALLDKLTAEEQERAITQTDHKSRNIVYWAAILNKENLLQTLLSCLSPMMQVETMTCRDSKGHNCIAVDLGSGGRHSMLLLSYIPRHKLPEVLTPLAEFSSLLLRKAINAENNIVLKVLTEQNEQQIGNEITQLISSQSLSRTQLDILYPLSFSYIIPYKQEKTKRYAFIFYQTTQRSGALAEAQALNDGLAAGGFSTVCLEWRGFDHLRTMLTTLVPDIANTCSLLFVSVMAHGNQGRVFGDDGPGEVSDLLNDIDIGLRDHHHIPVVFLLQACQFGLGTHDSLQDAGVVPQSAVTKTIALRRLHTALLQATGIESYAVRGAYTGAIAEEFSKADGVKQLYDMHQSAMMKVKQLGHCKFQRPEYRDMLEKRLVLPPATGQM